MDKIKSAFRTFMLRDIQAVEPGKQGYRVGDHVRIYKEEDGYVIRFLKGMQPKERKVYTDKLEQEGMKYRVGDDFTL